MKRIICLLVLTAMLLCGCGGKSPAATSEPTTAETQPQTSASTTVETAPQVNFDDPLAQLQVGDIYEFGTWEQDGDPENGAEPISWVLLKKEGTGALLLSVQVLELMPYRDQASTWEDSDVRKWLNSEFASAAFTQQEQEALTKVAITDSQNPEYDTYAGSNTQDWVFLLSAQEFESYLQAPFTTAFPSAACAQKDIYTGDNGCAWWWLRTPGKTNNRVACVNHEGQADMKGIDKASMRSGGIRPAIWLDYDPEKVRLPETATAFGDQAAQLQLDAMQDPQPGDTIAYGYWEQGLDPTTDIEPIEWVVLERDGSRVLLISKYQLIAQQYHGVYEDVTWENSQLRYWLNTTFLNRAFAPAHISRILITQLENPDNPSGTEGGNSTQDQIFILTPDQAEQYFASDEARIAPVCPYVSYELANREGSSQAHWWLRMPGKESASNAAYVRFDGAVVTYGFYVDGDGPVESGASSTVRPVMWLELGEL